MELNLNPKLPNLNRDEKTSPIGVFDSGLGGLSILKEMIHLMPKENYIFYEDSFHNPYGVKTEEELFNITSHIVNYLLEKGSKIIVIACNTATTCCIKALRERYPNVIFVGTVPAIKVAYDYNSKKTLILSTPYTAKSKRVVELIQDYKRDDQEIINISGEDLAHLIEVDDKERINNLLYRLLKKYKNIADALVLGCTHYSLIRDEIQEILPNTVLLDGCVGVSNEVYHQLENSHLLNDSLEDGVISIINSMKDEDEHNQLLKRSRDILES